ncbi:tyrosine-type recombinase/integrase [Brucella intermedia]|uniref:tyrosine-type recombinase/integrase n=1 Tax=Brucella intermedia TaxID=94625 RepID=UPI0007C67773|nr:site-specific integrase [Brucella intermedia]OAE39587.1 integrase [Brucella intermedia]
MAKSLTVKFIESVKPEESRREIPDGGMPGLYLVVQPSGAMSWAVRYRYAGKPKKLTIGAYPAFSLADARKSAGAALRAVSEGRDPADEKKLAAAERADTSNHIDDVLTTFLTRYVKPNNRASTARETERFIDNEIRPRWKGRLVQSITKRDVVTLLDAIVDRGAPISANRVHAILRRFFNWCMERSILDASPIATVPAPSKETSRDRVLSDGEIKLLWQACDAVGWPFGPMVQVLLLTVQRREEVAGASWREFQLEGKEPLWVIPKERAKNATAHAVPLAPSVVDLLNSLPKVKSDIGFLFTTTGESSVSGFSKAKAKIDEKMLEIAQKQATERGEDPEGVSIAEWRFHDLRRTGASGMAALRQPVQVVEAVLNHKSGSIKGVAAVYNRHDYFEEKRQALNAWANKVKAIISDAEQSGNVVRMIG